MPWSPKQHRLFEWAAHDPQAAAAAGYKIGQSQAQKMASEGITKVSGALMQRKFGRSYRQPKTFY